MERYTFAHELWHYAFNSLAIQKYKYYVFWHYPSSCLEIQFPKHCVLEDKQDNLSDKDKTIDNVQKRNICTNVPLLQTFRSFPYRIHCFEYKWINTVFIISCFIIGYQHFEIWGWFYIKDWGVCKCNEDLQIMQKVVKYFMSGCWWNVL
jgi:hypothetical protein